MLFCYHSAAFDRAAQALRDAIARREGIAVLAGEAGVGKTTLCRLVIAELDQRTVASLVSGPLADIDELVRSVLVAFGLISKDEPTGGPPSATGRDLMAVLVDFVGSLATLHASAVVMIDDAHTLPIEVLERIRILSDAAGPKLLQIVLAGNREVLAIVERQELRELNQHIAVRIDLQPLAADEISGYVMHRLAMVNGDATAIVPPAFDALFELSGGNPALVNLLCDRALQLAHRSSTVVDDDLIIEAAEGAGFQSPDRRRAAALQLVIVAVTLSAFSFVGATGAAWLFRHRIAHTIQAWQSGGSTPAPPTDRLSDPPPPSRSEPAEDLPR